MNESRQLIRPAPFSSLFMMVIGLALSPLSAGADLHVGQPLREALLDLNKQGIGLMFSSELVESWMRVATAPTSNDPLVAARQILATHDLVLIEGPGGRWLVTRSPGKSVASLVRISGSIVDADSGSEIVGAAVVSSAQTVQTNDVGMFSINTHLPIELEIDALGYKSASITVDSDQSVQIPLQREKPKVEEITVVASQYVMFSGDATAQFNNEEINRLPHMADDTARAIARLPAAAANDFSARFSVRGGWYDEATIRIDSLDLIDPFHVKDLSGSFSIIDSNLIERVDVLPGGFSAKYGNSVSGVVNITTLPPRDEPVYTVGVSLTSLFANGRGSFNGDAGGWLLSMRRGYLDWIFNRMESGDGRFTPRFYDILGKIEHSVGDRHTISAEFLAARDDFFYLDKTDEIRVDGESESLYLWTRLESRWSERLTSETVLWRNDVDRTRDNLVDDPHKITATLLDIRDVRDLGLRSDWYWHFDDKWQFEFGVELRDYQAEYDYSLVSRTNSDLYPGHMPIDRRTVADVEGTRFGIYTAARRDFGRLTTELGWRWDVETYSGNDEKISSPRLALSYEFNNRTRLTSSWGKYAQFQQPASMQVEDGIEKLFPATRTEHRMLGLEHQLDQRTIFRAEAYHKIYRSLRPRFTNLFNEFQPIPEAMADRVVVAAASANAYGLEMTLNRQSDVFSWRGSYVFSDVTDRVAGDDVPRDWNQRHAVDVILNWQGDRWNFNMASRWHSGWPLTDATAGIVDTPSGPQIGVVPGDRNADQNNNYFRVDARISRDVELRRGQITYFFEIYNLFDRENTCCIDDFDLSPGPQLVTHYGNWLPRFPSFGFAWTFE